MNIIARLAVCVCLLSLTACGGSDTEVHTTSVSQGQELIDLQRARDTGVISDSEYTKQKSKILSR